MLETIKNLFFLVLINLTYLFSFLITVSIFIIVLAQSWLFFATSITSEFADFQLAGQTFLTYGVLLLLILNTIQDFTTNAHKTRYSRSYLNCFTKPEHAVNFWLNLRFYLGLIAGIFFVAYSVKSLLGLCAIDFSMSKTAIDPDIYFGYYFEEMKRLSLEKLCLTLVLGIISYISIEIVKKKRELVFLQALLLVSVICGLILANLFAFFYVSMHHFFNLSLIASILACVICIISEYFGWELSRILLTIRKICFSWIYREDQFYETLRYYKNSASKQAGIVRSLRLLKMPIEVIKAQYLKSFLLFLTASSLLYWSMLYCNTTETMVCFEQPKLAWIFILVLWVYLTMRFLSIAAFSLNRVGLSFTAQTPLAPFILWTLYLSSLFEVFFLSQASNTNSFYSFVYALANPAKSISEKMDYSEVTTNQGVTVLIGSPLENTVSAFDIKGFFFPLMENMYGGIAEVFKRNHVNSAIYNFDQMRPALVKLVRFGSPMQQKKANACLSKLNRLEGTKNTMPTEQRAAEFMEVQTEVSDLVNDPAVFHLVAECASTSGTVRNEYFAQSLDRIADHAEAHPPQFMGTLLRRVADLMFNSPN